MRVWHSPWSWLKEIVPADSVAGNTLIGMFTRLIFRNPFQVARAAIVALLSVDTPEIWRLVGRAGLQPRLEVPLKQRPDAAPSLPTPPRPPPPPVPPAA